MISIPPQISWNPLDDYSQSSTPGILFEYKFLYEYFLYYFRNIFLKMLDLQDSKTTDFCHYLVFQRYHHQESLRDYFLGPASPHSRRKTHTWQMTAWSRPRGPLVLKEGSNSICWIGWGWFKEEVAVHLQEEASPEIISFRYALS